MVDFLSGKVRKTPPNQVPENRYKFLKLQDAEPDLGVASGNNYILTSDTEGSRVWKNPMDISGFLGSSGYTGSRGFTGSQGIQGFTGSAGPAGGEGSLGFTGSRGFTGSQGFTGSRGFTGSQGPQGVTGFVGSQGFTGSKGDIGFTGSQGIQGIQGFTGSRGFTGSIGFTGSQGKITTDAAIPPTPLYEGQIWFDTENIKTYVYYDSYWVEVGGSEMGTLYTRKGFTATSNSLLNNESQNINITGYKSYVLMTVSTSHACWVRFYSDQASRTADETRNINTDPIAGSGVIAEFITNGNQTQKVTPFIFGGNLETVPTDDLYMRVTNLSGGTTQINISVLLTRLEF